MYDRWDILVVGAGPAGSASAALLARRGARVLLVDKAHFPRPKPCGEYLSPGVLQALKDTRLSAILPPGSVRGVPGMDIVSPRGSVFRVQYQTGDRRFQACTLKRERLDMLFLEAAAREGAEVEQGFIARSPDLVSGVVRGVRGHSQGREVGFRAGLTLVADGARSILARALGLAARPRWPVRLGLVAHYEGTPHLRDGFGHMQVGTDGYCGIVPLPDGQINVAMVVRADAVRKSRLSATQYFDRWAGSHRQIGDVLQGCQRISTVRGIGPIGARSNRSWLPGALLVGDAAGFFDPFTGEGIYRALRGAELAADIALQALDEGTTSEEIVGGYDGLRRRAFRSKQAVTALIQLFVQYPGLMEYALPRLAERTMPADTLSAVLGDVLDARSFLKPGILWAALHP